MTIAQDIQGLEPGSLVQLFELDATSLGGGVTRFHAGTNGLRSSVVWNGQTYVPLPVEASGFEFNGKGQLPRPTIKVANTGGAMGALGALIMAVGRRRLDRKLLVQALDNTARLSCFVLFILIGSTVFSFTFNAADGHIWVEHLFDKLPGGALGFLIVVNVLVFILGCFIDFFEIAFIVIPMLLPVAEKILPSLFPPGTPIDGIGPDQLNIESLANRIKKEQTQELIFALNPNIQGDTTIYYIQKKLQGLSCRITTIARGIAFGGELEYADEMTLARSLQNRLPVEKYVSH